MFHPDLDREAIRKDLNWVWSHTVPGQLSNLAGTYQDFKSGNYGSARARSAAGIQIGLENFAIGMALGGLTAGGGVHAYRAYRGGKTLYKGQKKLGPYLIGYKIVNEYMEGDLEWQDLPQFAAPFIVPIMWERYTKPRGKSSRVARSGKAVGPRGGTKTSKKVSKKKGRVKRYPLPVDSSKSFGRHNPCSKGYFPKKIRGRWYCVRK